MISSDAVSDPTLVPHEVLDLIIDNLYADETALKVCTPHSCTSVFLTGPVIVGALIDLSPLRKLSTFSFRSFPTGNPTPPTTSPARLLA